MGICGQKGNPSLVQTPQEEKSNELKSPLKARNKIEANYCQLPNEIKHLKYNKLQEKDQHLLHAGLKNLGNTCFINSALQCLLNVQPLSDYFLSEAHLAELNRQNPMGSKGRITEVLAQIVNQISYEETKFVVPENFLSVIREFSTVFGNGTQQDSQEFLIFLLDYLHEDLNRVKVKPYIADKDYSSNDSGQFEEFARESWQNYLLRNKSIVVDLFQGQLKSTLRCLECNTFSHKFETFMYLSVPVPNAMSSNSKVKIEECITEFTREELLDVSEQWHCTKCSKKTKSTKKIDLWKTPNILIVHLKRFQYTRDSLGKKVNTLIDFQLREFNLSKNVAGKEKCQPIYDLFANHEGSLGGGHYTAYAKKWESDEWFNFDDSRVTPVSNAQKQLVSSKAYVLFYCKTSVDKFQRQTLSHPENWPHFNSPHKENSKTVKQVDHSLHVGGQIINRGSTFSTLSIIKQPIMKARTFHVSTNNSNNNSNQLSEQVKNNQTVKELLEQQQLQKNKAVEINTELFEESLDNLPNNSESIYQQQNEQKSNISKRKRIFTEHKADEIKMLAPIREKSSGFDVSSGMLNEKDKINQQQLPAGLLTGIKSKRIPRKQHNRVNECQEVHKSLLIEKDNINDLSSEQPEKDQENDNIAHEEEVLINNHEKMIESTKEVYENNSKDVVQSNLRQEIKDQSPNNGNIQQRRGQDDNQFYSLVDNSQNQQLEQHTKENSIIYSQSIVSQQTENSRFPRSPNQEGLSLVERMSNKNQEIIPNLHVKLKGNNNKNSNHYSDYLNEIIQEQDWSLSNEKAKSRNQEINQQNNECSPQEKQPSYKNSYAFKTRRNNVNQNVNHWEQALQDRGHSSNFLPLLHENARNIALKTEDGSNSSSKKGPSITSAHFNYAKLRRSSQSGRDQYNDMKPVEGKDQLFEEIRKRSISRQNLPSNGIELGSNKYRGSLSTKEANSYYGMSSVTSNPLEYQPQMGQHFQLQNKDLIGKNSLSPGEVNALLQARQNRKMNYQRQELPSEQRSLLTSPQIAGMQAPSGHNNNIKMTDILSANFQTSTIGKYSTASNYSTDINKTPSVLNYQRLNSYQERTGSPSHSTTAGTFESSPSRRTRKSSQIQGQGRGTAKLFQNANRINSLGNNNNKQEDPGEPYVDSTTIRQPFSYPPNGLF